ncbi:ABC transporter permease [Streptomyces wuyuanensis]|uniref:ABC transporter permease n=1 Tax=Streptomyces wuyuanensis TaxID=1196353 RepID=UPI003D74FDA6
MSALATPLTGTLRVLVRQHRSALRTLLALFALGCAGLVATRLWFTSGHGRPGAFGPEDLLLGALDRGSTLLVLAPLLIAAYVAGPLFARETETGTHRVAWTQSVSPLRWTATKLVLVAAAVTAATAAFVAVFRWSRAPVSDNAFLPLWSGPVYTAYGTTATAYALLAVGVGALTGLLVHRAFAAMGVAGLVTGTVMLVLGTVRHTLWPTETLTGRPLPHPRDTWWVESGSLDGSGERVSSVMCPGYWDPCDGGGTGVTDFARAHPPSHFWPIQLVESGIVLALAAVATYAAFRVLRRRHG